MKRWMLLGLTAMAALLWLACNGIEEAPPAATPAPTLEETPHVEAGAVHVSLNEWSITGEEGQPIPNLHAGEITFEVHNDGAAPHELVIIRTDLAADALPVADGKVDEEAAGEVIGRIKEFPGGQIEVATFDLEAGRYVFICNIPGHYEQGMFVEVTVQ